MRLLLIEDNKETALTIKDELSVEYVIDVSFQGKEGEELALTNDYDLIMLDINLPDKNGIDICKALRKARVKTPILMLTGELQTDKKVSALDTGADDYITKPFAFAELKARIRALLRRQYTHITDNVLSVGDLTLDVSKNLVKRGDTLIHLRRKEINLLEYLIRNSTRVVTRDMILDHVWDSASESMHNIVDVHIKFLRDKIDRKFPKKLIKTVYGLGYKIEE